ncbi:MAG: DUF502 domain-containing protein [Planctomycetota bacterium]
MTNVPPQTGQSLVTGKRGPFRRAILRGLGVVMPPLLTLVLFIWAWTTIDGYVLRPTEYGLREVVVFVSMQKNIRREIPQDANPSDIEVRDRQGDSVPPEEVMNVAGAVDRIPLVAERHSWRIESFEYDGTHYVPAPDGRWIAKHVLDLVSENPGQLRLSSASSRAIYERFVKVRYLPRWRTIPVFLLFFTALLYLLGRFIAAGVGRIVVANVEALIHRLPVVRNVYSSVKQVTDFIFSEREIEFNRVVAVQYPSKGIWSLGFVTGESMLDIRSAVNEPVVSVLMPTSPMPVTGFTITVCKSETIDLDITVDQAIQFTVSCGVVVPLQQQQTETSTRISEAIARRLHTKPAGQKPVEEDDAVVRGGIEQPRRSDPDQRFEASGNGDGQRGETMEEEQRVESDSESDSQED